jgi:FHS family Na+ dependent glucose MFS transporter 1
MNPPPENTGKLLKTAAYYVAFVGIGLCAASLGPTLSGLAKHTRTNLSGISFLFTARSLGYLCGAFNVGRLYDRTPGHPVMAIALVIMAALVGLVPMTSLLWLLAVVFVLIGMTESVVDIGGNTLLVWVHQRNVGPFMNGLHFFFGVGAFLAPLMIARVMGSSGDITWAYWMIALLMLPIAIWLLCLSSPVNQRSSQHGVKGQIHYPLFILILLFFFFYVGAEVGFGGWIFTYAVSQKWGSNTTAAYLTSAFWGTYTLGRLLAIPLAVRFKPRTILFGDLIGCLLSLSIMILWSKSLTASWLGTLGLGLSMASIFPTMISFAERHIVITGQITGWFFMMSSLGAMFLPWLIGQFFESIGPQVTMVIISSDLICALGILIGLRQYLLQREPAR